MKTDCGSTVNTLPWGTFQKTGISEDKIVPTDAMLISYSQHVIIPLGMVKATIKLQGRVVTDWFMILEGNGTPLLGFSAGRALGLYNIAQNSEITYKPQSTDQPKDYDRRAWQTSQTREH